MGIDKVKATIIEEAEREAQKIMQEGEKEGEVIIKNAEEKIKEYREKAEEETSRMLEQLEKREIARAEFDVKKSKLDKKKKIIDRVFEQVKERIDKASSEKRKAWTKDLLSKAKKEIDVKYVYGNKRDAIRGIEFKEIKILGGIIAENKDRTVSVDFRFEEILDEIREKNLQEIAKILF